jgi:hypothetical protein
MEEELYRCVLERNNALRCSSDWRVLAMLPVHLKQVYEFCTDPVAFETECFAYLPELLLSGEDVRKVQTLCAQVNAVYDRHRVCLCGYEDADFFADTYAQAVEVCKLQDCEELLSDAVPAASIAFVEKAAANALLSAQVRIWRDVLGKTRAEDVETYFNQLLPAKRECISRYFTLL